MGKIDYYVLKPVMAIGDGDFFIANASIGHCGLCGCVTTTMGGSNDQICVPCADVVLRKKAVGAIKWDEGTS